MNLPLTAPLCRLCDRHSRTPSSTSACRRRARATSPPTQLDRVETFYPLHVRVCPSCLLVQLPSTSRPQATSSATTRTSPPTATRGSSTPRATSTRPSSGSAWTSARSSSRSRATTATCCSTSIAGASAALGIEPAANVAGGRRGQGHADRGRCSSARRPARAGRRRARQGRPGRGQQRLRPRPGHRRLRQGTARARRRRRHA